MCSNYQHRERLYDAIASADDAWVNFKLPRSAFKSEFEWRIAVLDVKARLSAARYEERLRAIQDGAR